ncbi:hypothetical protein ANCDUO_01751 [Ancylostoma duodenale]|uniref:Receptor ligand binding region domain-containing protein n=1 Tax=Ancylostoma duodenale TaxID=51022 RepID=A0A0C2DY59_9BILA|nr:hypothetical protein ANCDUO_01751 [Ancylostoma duodenale]
MFTCSEEGDAKTVNTMVKTVTVGIIAVEQLLPQVAWSVCGGAVGLALDKIREEHNFEDFDFRFLVGYSQCDLAQTLGLGIEYMSNQQADIVIGPPCPQGMQRQ